MKKIVWKMLLISLLLLILPISVAPLYAKEKPPRTPHSADIKLVDGYHIEPIVTNLSVPTTAIFDGNDLIIGESGWKDTAKARVLRVKPDGNVETLAEEGLVGPVTGLLMIDGKLYISHKGKVSLLEGNKTLRDIVTGLPSNGDHQNNNIVLGPDRKIYLGQGTVTNAGVVGEDSYIFGWLEAHPDEHDIPCKDITLTGKNFETKNPLTTENKDDKVTTGAYKPFGTPSKEGEIIKGNVKCNGSILRFNPDGSDLEVFAWGLRNPFGLEFDTSGQLWATFHGADVRGSRGIYNDPDYLIKVEKDAWYGWPEYFDSEPVTNARFKDPTKEQPTFLWKDHPKLTYPYMTFESHSAANGLAFSPSNAFGYGGDAFVVMYGSFSVATAGTDPRLPGFKVVRAAIKTKEISDFASNKLPGPSYLNRLGGFDRPSEILFAPDKSMYIVDWGASTIGSQGLKYVAGTGVVWRIYQDTMKPLRPQGAIVVKEAPVPENEQKPELRNVPETITSLFGPTAILVGMGIVILALIVLLLVWIRRRWK